MPDDRTFLLVIPAFKESHRLPAFLGELLPALRESDLPIRVRVVDDGSGVREQHLLQELVRSLQPEFPFLEPPVLNAVHRGKGFAVHTGWRLPPLNADFLAFVDADGSIPPADILRLCRLASASDDPDSLIVSSRKPSPTTVVRRRFLRKVLNRLFAHIVNVYFRLAVYDPQCGLKVISAPYFKSIEAMLWEHGFIFDVELLAHAKADGVAIRDEPINWTHRHHNRIHLLKDGMVMLIDLTRQRRRLYRERSS